jgi:hypothetical protein
VFNFLTSEQYIELSTIDSCIHSLLVYTEQTYSLTDSCVLSTLPHSTCISQQIYVFTLLHSRDNNCRWPYSLFTLLQSIRYICLQVHVLSRCTLLRSRCTISWYLLALFFNADIGASKSLHSFFTLLNGHKRSSKKIFCILLETEPTDLYIHSSPVYSAIFIRIIQIAVFTPHSFRNHSRNISQQIPVYTLHSSTQQLYQPADSCVYSSLSMHTQLQKY